MGTARERGIADAQEKLVNACVPFRVRKSATVQPEGIRRLKKTDPALDFLLRPANSGVVAKVVALPRFNTFIELKLVQRPSETIVVGSHVQVGRTSL